MSDFSSLVTLYSYKYNRKIKSICAPLTETFGITCFVYYKIDAEGRFTTLTNTPDQLEFYYKNSLFLDEPFLCHPNLYRPGYALISCIQDPLYLELNKKQFGFDQTLLILEKSHDMMEGSLFTFPGINQNHLGELMSKLDLLHKFSRYFKREAESILKIMGEHDINLHKQKGKKFLVPEITSPLISNHYEIEHFLKKISPLSKREQECLALFKEGKSSQATAAILNLSQRTVEHYFESIKLKLNCDSKWDLLCC